MAIELDRRIEGKSGWGWLVEKEDEILEKVAARGNQMAIRETNTQVQGKIMKAMANAE